MAVVIRFIPIMRYQFSYDELCGLRNSLFSTWHDMVNYGVKLDTHPILVQLIINAVVKTIGYSEVWVKLPFLLFSLAAIVYAYLFGLKWLGKLPALISASIFSFSYIFLFYAPLARMYAGGLFFSTALVYYLFEICFNEEKKLKHYVWFVIFILLCALNNHLSCLFALSCGFFGLFYQSKKSILPYLLSCIAAVLLYLPHLSITMFQLSMGGIGHSQDGWLAVPDKLVLFSLLKTLFGTGYIWVIFVLMFFISFIINKSFSFNKKIVLLILLFFFNYAIIHLYSVYKAPIFQYSVMLFSAPCFIWTFASGINFKSKFLIPVTFVSLTLIFQSLVVKYFSYSAVLNQNAYQSKGYVDAEDLYGKGNVEAYFMASQRYFVVNYELKYKRKFNYFIGEDFADIAAFKKQIRNSKAKYIFLGEPTETQLEIAREYFPHLKLFAQTLNVNSYCLSKINSYSEYYEKTTDLSTYNKSNKYGYTLNIAKLKNGVYPVDSTEEYFYSASTQLKNLDLREGNVILAKVKLKSKEELKDVGFNFNITNAKDSSLFFGGPDLSQFYTSDSTGYYAYAEVFMGSDTKKWMKENAKIMFFFWNRGKKKFELSDFSIRTVDYWPARWSWWD